jgi:hypothetical protein
MGPYFALQPTMLITLGGEGKLAEWAIVDDNSNVARPRSSLMAVNQNKTKPTPVTPVKFLQAVEPERRRLDGHELLALFARVTGLKPRMWGDSIIGYGRYRYKYDSGREGEYLLTGFSPRKSALTIYIMPGYRDMSDKLARLGKHKTGKSCLYINKLADIDLAVLEDIISDGVAYMRANYETFDK